MSVVDQEGEYAVEPEGGGNMFTRKMGPLPMWAWMIIGVAAAYLGYRYYQSKSGTATTASTGSTNGTGPGANTTGETGTIDSSGNSNDVIDLLESALSTDAADITTLQNKVKTLTKTEAKQQKEINALRRKKVPKK